MDGGTGTDIPGATGSTYEPVAGDVGKTLKVRVSFTDDADNAEERTSAATAAVRTGTPSISGTAQVGERLTASTSNIGDSDGVTRVSYSYRWIRVDGGIETDIPGATGSTYEPVAGDVGKTLKVRVSFTDDADNAEERTSAATTAVRAALVALAATFEGMPAEHDGASAFGFELRFSEEVGLSYVTVRDALFAVTGGRVTGARRLARPSNRRWEVTVEPDSGAEVGISLAPGRACGEPGAVCTADGRALSAGVAAVVRGPEAVQEQQQEPETPALTASFSGMPPEHDGASAFTFEFAFSADLAISYVTVRDSVLGVTGGAVTQARRRVQGSNRRWEVTVEPDSFAAVRISLAPGAACDSSGAPCNANGAAAAVPGPAALSVADAEVHEAADAVLAFRVTLDRSRHAVVTVDYATADGTATAGADYTPANGTLSFAAGETVKTVSVAVLDDSHDEGSETMALRLSNATGARIAGGTATGTIENTDHMPAAWLARFGRTVTGQVLDAVEARLTGPREAGARATLAGQALPFWDGSGKAAANDNDDANASDRTLAGRDRDAMASIRDWMGANGGRHGKGPEDRVQSRALTGRDFVTGTSFALTGGSAEAGGYAGLWGRGAISGFDGRAGDLSLDGEVTTGLIGADWAADPGSGAGRWTAGLAVGHARGTGGYRASSRSERNREGGNCNPDANADDYRGASGCAGEVETTLTGLWPYAGVTLTDRLSAWAAAGYGAGELKLTPGGETDGPFTTDLTMAMGAAGLRSQVLAPPAEGGLALAVKGDARFTRTASEATKDAKGVGRLAAATADVWLVRSGIEGSRRFALGGDGAGMVLTPTFELGVRLDGGDAETGLGADLGGGLAFAAPKQGVALDLKARGLVAHEASGFREWGASASLAWDPRPTTDRGLALTLHQSLGGSPAGGMDALLGRETLAGLGANDDGATASAGRLEAELGYGIALFGGGFTGTPNLGFALSEAGRDYRLGWRLTSARKDDPGFEIGLEATRREAANDDAEHGLLLRGAIRW